MVSRWSPAAGLPPMNGGNVGRKGGVCERRTGRDLRPDEVEVGEKEPIARSEPGRRSPRLVILLKVGLRRTWIYFPAGTRRRSSSNQFSTTVTSRTGPRELPGDLTIRKRFPSSETS